MSKDFTELSAKEKNTTNGGGAVQALAEWIKAYLKNRPL